MALSLLPVPPQRSDPANFAARGDAFMAALPTFVSEFNAQVPNVVAGDQGITGNLVVNGNSTLGNATNDVITIGVTGIIKDAAGNVGMGGTPVFGQRLELTKSLSYNASADLGLAIGSTDNGSVDSGSTSTWRQWVSGDANGQSLSFQGFVRGGTWTDRMRIDSAGNLLVGQAAAGGSAGVNGNGVQIAPGTVVVSHVAGTSSGAAYLSFGLAGGAIGSITQSGTSGTSYNTTSDRRLKTAIVDAPAAGADIDAIRVRSFDWLADGSHQSYGFIAQELAEVAPYAVHQPVDPDQMMAVDYSKLVPMLVKEVQSLRTRLAALEARP